MDELALVLSLPKDDYKTHSKADLELIDQKLLWTPLVTAINQGPQGHQESIAALLRAGANPFTEVSVYYETQEKMSPAFWAASMGQVETLRTIRRICGDEPLLRVYPQSGTILHAACLNETQLDMLEYLIEEFKDTLKLGEKNENGDTVFHLAAGNGQKDSILLLLAYALPEYEQEESSSCGSKFKFDNETLKSILNAQNKQGYTILHLLSLNKAYSTLDKVRQLSGKLLDEGLLDTEGNTARDLERQSREQDFREQMDLQRKETEARERRKKLQEEKKEKKALLEKERAEDDEEEEEERISREKVRKLIKAAANKQGDQERDPETAARKFRMMIVFFFLVLLVAVYFLFDFVASSSGKKEKLKVQGFGGKRNDF